MAESKGEPAIKLPAGYLIEGERETSQMVPGHGVEQGVVFGVRHPSGLATTVFVPYARMNDAEWISKMVADHITGIRNVEAMTKP